MRVLKNTDTGIVSLRKISFMNKYCANFLLIIFGIVCFLMFFACLEKDISEKNFSASKSLKRHTGVMYGKRDIICDDFNCKYNKKGEIFKISHLTKSWHSFAVAFSKNILFSVFNSQQERVFLFLALLSIFLTSLDRGPPYKSSKNDLMNKEIYNFICSTFVGYCVSFEILKNINFKYMETT